MERRKLTKEDIDKVRGIEGFPIGTDEDIIALSRPPYYTACPNPFIEEFIRENGTPYDEATDDYHCEPFAADVSEGKTDPIYNAHSYHTKVPFKAIMKYILHYTKPNDIVYDGFCGSGMTGVAALMCGNEDAFHSLSEKGNLSKDKIGVRKAIIGDLSPAASFISYNYCTKHNSVLFSEEANDLLEKVKKKYFWMYETKPTSDIPPLFMDERAAFINYIVWSDVFICPHCSSEIVYWDTALDKETKRVSETFTCPQCHAQLKKASCERARIPVTDSLLNRTVKVAKQQPVLINYTYGGKRYEKNPDSSDYDLIKRIDCEPIPNGIPIYELPEGFNTDQPKKSHGVYYAHQFYTKRTLIVLGEMWKMAEEYQTKDAIRLILTGIMQISSKMSSFRYDSRNTNNTAGGILKGTLYIPSIQREGNVFQNYKRRYSAILSMMGEQDVYPVSSNVLIQVSSATNSLIPDETIDYIFTDPPFGSNINYSELSTTWEAWLRVSTNSSEEAIINQVQKKGLFEYQQLMSDSFRDYYRILKPNRWMTVEFHNSQNAVWNSIQEAISRAGFIIADVRTLDKKQGSFKQVTTTSAVKQDLVISAYKPTDSFRKKFVLGAGTEETAWAFVRQHLENIPVVVIKSGKIELIAERQSFLLFDRMVAYHIMQGIPVPIDATDFYKGLDEKFLKRDNMYFLPDQVNEYDTARIVNEVEPIQFSLFVTNEKTAITWLYQQLDEPQTYAEIQPKFMQEVKSVDRYEDMPELAVLLEENFLQDEKGRWYIPDVTKEGDVAKLREKKLWKEFEGYMNSKGKLKLFRSEAIRVGFSRLWKDKSYQAIVDIANRLPEQTIQEDPNLLMYYDISLSRV